MDRLKAERNRPRELVMAKFSPNMAKHLVIQSHAFLRVQVIEIKAPNLSHLCISGNMEFSVGEASQMKKFFLWRGNSIYYARAELLSPMPNLETLELVSEDEVSIDRMEHESVFGGSAHLRQPPECRHDCLKSVEIKGFSSAKDLVVLTCCIVKNAYSLERLVLGTVPFQARCSPENIIPCLVMRKTA